MTTDETVDAPVVSAVDGVDVGWGIESALMAGVRIADESARPGEPLRMLDHAEDVRRLLDRREPEFERR